jgi:hypothetical protein
VGLVREAVELRPDLSDLGHDELLVAAAPIGEVVHERALDVHVEAPRAEERHAGAEHLPELDDLAGLDQLDRVEHGLRLHVIGRAALVARAPFRRAARAFRRRRPTRRLGEGGRAGQERGP